MKRNLPYFLVGATPGIVIFILCVVVSITGKAICFFNDVVCFVRPDWLSKLLGAG